MQVSQASDHITHAVIGTQKAKSFKIAQSAEFCRVLSSALYSDKPLACVREVLCNAWDAHIAMGVTNQPIEITLTEDELIIRDFGPGIHPDKIEDVYCVYGSSTKTHDGNQTGGFGLGSKAPFAVSDHFEVTSFHQGTKTIYHMSIGSVINDGEPSALPIVTLPTDETGLQVKVPLKAHSKQNYSVLIKKIVRFGEINAVLNGKQLFTIPFSRLTEGFLITEEIPAGLHIRYGNVVYPVNLCDELTEQVKCVQELLAFNREFLGWSGKALILQAPPHSIAVTPSRESLSMSERTITTIKDLLTQFISKVSAEITANEDAFLQESIDLCWLQHNNFGRLFNQGLPNNILSYKIFLTINALARYRVSQDVKNGRYSDKLQRMKLQSLVVSGYDQSGLARNYLQHLKNPNQSCYTNWFHRKVTVPLWKAMESSQHLNIKNLKLITGNKYAGYNFTEFPKVRLTGPRNYSPYTHGVVILAYTREAIRSRAESAPLIKYRFGILDKLFAYIVPKKAEQVAEAKAFFKGRGFQVLDLTVQHSWEPILALPEPKKAKVFKPKGFIKLSSLVDPNGYINYYTMTSVKPEDFIKSPEFVVKVSSRERDFGPLPKWSILSSRAFCQLYADRGTVVTTEADYQKAIKAGAKSLADWLPDTLKKDFGKDKVLLKYLSHRMTRERFSLNHTADTIFKTILDDEILVKKYDLWFGITPEHKQVAHIVSGLAIQTSSSLNSVIKELFGAISEHKPTVKLVNQLLEDRRYRLLDHLEISAVIKSKQTPQADIARKILVALLKG